MKNMIIILILLSFTQCKKDQDSEERRTGDKTVSFYLNGKLWQNSLELAYGGSINGTGMYSAKFQASYADVPKPFVSVEGNIWNHSKLFIMLPLMDTIQANIPGNYNMDNSHGYIDTGWEFRNMNHMVYKLNNIKYLSKENKGWAEVTRWETQKNNNGNWNILHYEGKFEAILYNENDPLDSLIITDGLWND